MTRGGKRKGAGRPRKPGALTMTVSPRFSPAEVDSMHRALLPGETISGFVRDAALAMARARREQA